MSLATGLRKLRRLSWADRLLLLEALACLALLRLGILLLPLRRLAPLVGLRAGAEPLPTAAAAGAERIAWAMAAAAARTPWDNTCLVQALAGALLLRLHGLPATLRLGVAKGLDSPERVSAHAWLHSGDTFVTGEAGHERFAPLATFGTATHRRARRERRER